MITALSLCFSTSLLARDKLAQTGMMFLNIGVDARAAGMGEAVTSLNLGSASQFYNPAGLAAMTEFTDISFTHIKWFADMKLNAFSASFSPSLGKYGVFGISFVNIDYGDVEGTMVWQNPDGFIDTEILKPAAMAIGLSYARKLSDKFAVGGQVRYVSENLGKSIIENLDQSTDLKKNLANALAFDFGTQYFTGFKSLIFSMSVKNFSQEIKYETEGFQLPLLFRIGFSLNLMDFMSMDWQRSHALWLNLDALHPRSHSEQLNAGLEYCLLNMLYLRSGYLLNYDDCGFSYGFGLRKYNLAIDYAYTPFDILDNVQRITIRLFY